MTRAGLHSAAALAANRAHRGARALPDLIGNSLKAAAARAGPGGGFRLILPSHPTWTKLKGRLPAADTSEVFALACTECGRTRDPRVDFCPSCGSAAALEDPAQPIEAGGHHFDTGPMGLGTISSLDRARERTIALGQQQALLEGREPPSAQLLGAEFDAAVQLRHHELQARGAEIMQETFASGPGTSGRWEANPFGLSGRMIRGYRHWRHRR